MSYFALGNWVLGLSIMVSTVGALVGFTCIRESRRSVTAKFRVVWLVAASASIGVIGVWLAVFVSMLGVKGPGGVVFRYDVTRLLGAATLAGIAVFAGLIFLGRTLQWPRLIGCAVAMSVGLALTMYVGMDAVQVQGWIDLDWMPIVGSITLILVTSIVTLWFVLRHWPVPALAAGGLAFALAVVGAHFLWLAGLDISVDSRISTPDGEDLFTLIMPMFAIGMLSLAIPITAILVAPDRRIGPNGQHVRVNAPEPSRT